MKEYKNILYSANMFLQICSLNLVCNVVLAVCFICMLHFVLALCHIFVLAKACFVANLSLELVLHHLLPSDMPVSLFPAIHSSSPMSTSCETNYFYVNVMWDQLLLCSHLPGKMLSCFTYFIFLWKESSMV